MDKWKEADEKIKDIRKALIGYIDSFVQAVEDKIEYQQLGEESVVETKEIKEDIHDHVKQVFDSENDD